MSVLRKISLAVIGLAFAISALAGAVLPSGVNLYPGQSVYSPSGKYYAVMQGDGNFVMYRSADGAVRYATMKFGSFLAMQGDGNLVEYSSTSTPLWTTTTAGYPGAYMAVQDDGNLVIYSAGGTPLWSIGPDSAVVDGPKNTGDVVARDLNIPGLGWLGHLGVWTGSKVAEVVQGQSNAVRYVTWDSFRTATNAWPTARPNVPSYLVYYCSSASCGYYPSTTYPGVQSRMALANRANQIYLIGADYTLSSSTYVAAQPAYPGVTAIRGLYRCDSFVVDVFWGIVGWNMNHSVPSAWNDRINNLHWYTPYSPTSVWNKLKN